MWKSLWAENFHNKVLQKQELLSLYKAKIWDNSYNIQTKKNV